MKKKRPNRRRSIAAKKGWATRRRIQRKRSRAAKRGWVTRSANIAAAIKAEKELEATIEAIEEGAVRKAFTTWIISIHIHSNDEAGHVTHERQCDFVLQDKYHATHDELIRFIRRGTGADGNPVILRWVLGEPKKRENAADVAKWMLDVPGANRVITFARKDDK